MNKIGIAVVGCGYWGMNYVRLFSELPQTRLVGVCDQRPQRLAEVQARFPGLATEVTVDDLLHRDGIDAVVICTQAAAHHAVAVACLEAGKHLLIEKPITITARDAEDLVERAAARHLTLMVGHTFIYNPGIRRVKAYIEQGEIGQVYYLYARRTNLGPIRNDVSALWDLASHDVSIFNYLLDSQPSWVSAVGSRVLGNGHEDVGFVSLGYPDNVLGHIHVSWADPSKVREVVVVGSKKRILFDDLNNTERVRVFEKGVTPVSKEAASYGEHQFLIRDGDIISPHLETSEPLKNQCLHFLDCLGQGKCPTSDGKAGLDVVRVMEAVDQSIHQQGAPVVVSKGE